MITIEQNASHEQSSSRVVILAGTVEHFEAVQCKNRLSELIQSFSGKSLHLDLTGLESVSSIALSFLLFGLRFAKKSDCELHYLNMPPALFNMARVSGIETILLDKS